MAFLIKHPEKPRFLRSEIDSGGMSVVWMDIIYADKFEHRKDAESLVKRCEEHYPKEKFEIVERRS